MIASFKFVTMKAWLATSIAVTFFLCLTCQCEEALAKGKLLSASKSVDILVKQLKKDKFYEGNDELKCLFFRIEGEDKKYIDIAIHEKHDDGCPGDSNFAPVLDRFRVHRSTKVIEWYDPVESELLPYKVAMKTKKKRFEENAAD